MSFRKSYFECFSSSLRLLLNSLFEHRWSFLPVNDRKIPVCFSVLFSYCLWKFVYRKSVHAAGPGFTCVTQESISHTDHTCLDHTFMWLITFKLGGRRMRLVFFLTCGVSASCANKPKWGSSMNSGTVPWPSMLFNLLAQFLAQFWVLA